MAFSQHATSSSSGSVCHRQHEYRIDNFSLLKSKGVGTEVKSNPFSVGGQVFQVLFYPAGYSAEVSDFVSVYVKLLSSPVTEITVWLELYFIDRYGDRWRVSNNTAPLQPLGPQDSYRLGPVSMSVEIHTRGYVDYYLRSLLENSSLLTNDRLTLQCTVVIAKSATSTEIPPPSDLKESLERLFEDGPNKDVSFAVSGETIQAHRFVLSNRSNHFRTIFDRQEDNNAIIQIEDITAPAFKAVLRYIYSDSVPVYDTATMLDLMVAADKCCVSTLTTICENQLCEHLSIDQVGACLGVANKLDRKMLKSRCFWFISMPEHNEAVMKTHQMQALADECPDLMCELVLYITGRKSK